MGRARGAENHTLGVTPGEPKMWFSLYSASLWQLLFPRAFSRQPTPGQFRTAFAKWYACGSCARVMFVLLYCVSFELSDVLQCSVHDVTGLVLCEK